MKSCFLALVLFVFPAAAQEQKQHFTINTGTPEGQMLQAIGQETDDTKKLVFMQDFLAKYPKHEGASWVSGQLQALYLKQKDYDKTIEAGEKGLAADPTDLELAYNNLKAAEGKEDPDLVKRWSARTAENAHKITGTGKPPADDDQKQQVDYAKEVATYSSYALMASAAKQQDPKKIVELVDALVQQDPKSQYVPQISGSYLNALGAGKACPAAEKLAGNNAKDADALLFAADCSLRQNRADRAIAHATGALSALASRPKPEGMSDADWGSRKSTMFGRANWIAGVGYGSQGKYGPSDKALRAALPLVRGDSQLNATALFYLGLSNYNLGKTLGDKKQMREGLAFFEQSAEIKSGVQDQAAKNVRAIRTELGIR
jgi:tetratricopeptide (TPR) repeat protein